MKFLFIGFILFVVKAQVDINNKVNWIDQHQLGKTLLDTIYLQLKAQEPIERLLGTLDQLEERYYQEQKEDDQQHRDFQDSCTADLTALSKDLKESQEESLRLEAKLEGELYPRKQITSQVLQQKQIELKGLNKELNELDDQRTQEQQEFELKVAEHQEVIEIISEAKTIFSENLQTQNGEPAFIQRTNKLSQDAQISKLGVELLQKHFSQSMKRATKFVHRKSWGKLFKTLATITTRSQVLANPDSVGRIIELCQQLLDKVQDSLSLERFAEDKRVQAFNKARNLLTISINVTTTSIANALSELALINEQIDQTTSSLDNVNQRIDNVQSKYNDRYNQCEEEAGDYQKERQQRDEDRSVVSETIGLVNQQLRGLKEQLALRLQAGEKLE